MQKKNSRIKRSIRWVGFFSLILLCSQAVKVFSQDIDFNGACPNPTPFNFPSVLSGAPIAPLTISAINTPGGGAATMEIRSVSQDIGGGVEIPYCSAPSCTSPFTVTGSGIVITASGATVTVNGTPTSAAVGTTIIFTIRATVGGSSCDWTYHLPVIRKPLALGIVLDQSGSMGTGYDGSFSPAAGQRRWDGLVTGVGAMATQLGFNTLLADDKLGVILFSSGVNTAPAPFDADVTVLQDTYTLMEGKIGPLDPSGSTALGAGIIEARDRLLATGPSTKKVMIVFSDGVQNAGDLVKSAAPNQYVQTESGENISGSGAIEIYTICLGSSGYNPVLMSGIASSNGGSSLVTSTGAESDFSTFFSTHIVNILSGSSPQFIDVRKSSFPAGNAPVKEETFTVNKGSEAVNVTVAIPNRYEARITSLTKDGTNLIQYAKKTRGSGFINIGLRLPATGLSGVTLDGEWKVGMQIGSSEKEDVPYTFTILTDDHAIDPTYSTSKEFHKVGDTLSPIVTLAKLGQTIDNAMVEVLVGKPGDDVNNLIALSNVSFDVLSVDPGSPDAAKLAALLKDPEFLNKIKMNNQALNLTYDSSKKKYTGSFTGLDVTGVYQLFYRITVNDPQFGKIFRFHQKTVYVRFGDVDLANSNINVSVNASGQTILTWRPIASNHRLIGSGWGKAIGIEGAKILNMVDKGDGSYILTLNATPDTEVTITLSDDVLYTGPLKDFGHGSACKIFDIPCWLFWTIVILLLIVILWLIFRKK